MRSLRNKLVVLSILISGVTLIALAGLSWVSTAKIFRHGIDLKLEEKVSRVVSNLHPRLDEDRFRNHLQITFGDEIEEGSRVVRVVDEVDKKVLFEAPTAGDWASKLPSIFQPSTHDLPPRRKRENRPPPHPEFKHNSQPPGNHLPLDGHPPRRESFSPPEGNYAPPHSGNEKQNIHFETIEIDGKNWRLAIDRQKGYSVLIGRELSQAQAELQQISTLYLIAIPLALCLIGLGGWVIADKALRPLRLITETTRQISADDLSARIPENPHNDSEIAELTHVLNNMIDRLEKSFSLANRFSSDVSHELKTPLAIMQGEVESALKECEPKSRQRKKLRVIREEIQRLKAITRQLMLLAQADIGQLIHKMEVFNLSEELEAIAEDGSILSKEAGIRLTSKIETAIAVKGDAILIRQALLNLVVNAIKYNHRGGEVRLFLSKKNCTELLITVENTGPGIPDEDRERVFHRFHRGDKSRSREIEGFGLGLCLALEIIRAHSGELSLTHSNKELTRFEVSLPIAHRGLTLFRLSTTVNLNKQNNGYCSGD